MLIKYTSNLKSRTIAILRELLPLVLLAMLVVRIGEQFGLSEFLALILAPVMQLVGLPSEAGIVWAVTLLTGIYGGAGAYLSIMPGLELSTAQHSILCSMMLFAHALPVEQTVVYRVGASPWITGAVRIVAAICYGVVVNWICLETGFLSDRLDSPIASIFHGDPGWLQWFTDTFTYMLLLVAVVAGLLMLIDVLKAIGFIELLNTLLRPLLAVVGVDRQLAPVATTGVLLGVVYGGALMLEEIRKNNYPRHSILTAMMLVSILHALIEDTLLVMAIGANVWIVFVWRVPFALLFIGFATRFFGVLHRVSR